MVVCDLVRGGLLAGMSVAGLPTPLLLALLTVVVFLGPAFTSAEVSMIASVLHGERYRAATGLRMITNQLAQAAGFALGGVAIALVGPRWALLVDAFSFLASAAVVAVGATGVVRTARRSRPAPDPLAAGSPPSLRAIFKDQQMRALIGLTWLAGFFVVPEGLAAPYAAAVGGGPGSVGLLMTAIPLGSVIGAGAVLRLLRPRGRLRAVRIMAVATGLPLLGCAAEPGIGPTALLWLVSGVFAAYMIDVMTSVVQIAPEHSRGRLIGLVGAGLTGVQGIGTVVFGVIAEHVGTGRAIAAAGGAGALIAAYLTQSLRRSLGRHVATISVPEVLSTS
jgi:predicted MFS family arabinose efflux permease